MPSPTSLGMPACYSQWSGLFVPTSVGDDVVRRLRAAARRVAADPTVQQTLRTAGSPVDYLDAPEFQLYWDADAKLMNEVVRRIGKVE